MQLRIQPTQRMYAASQAQIGGFRSAGNAPRISSAVGIFLRHFDNVGCGIKCRWLCARDTN